ncbi:hypothetical protein OH76DRAFT_1408957 [Lentinus brumalis]|uniref:Uncharacterized protein n=1 Tax=Lentinus brumalis TaxID=2498619 RepID=A0A371CW88_9APHY|nr:hypothetical protein OH76DRAFT_1408957 [Polyporus brumalis]
MKSPTTRSRGTPRLNVQLRFPSTTRICIAHPYFVSTESEAYRNNEQVIWEEFLGHLGSRPSDLLAARHNGATREVDRITVPLPADVDPDCRIELRNKKTGGIGFQLTNKLHNADRRIAAIHETIELADELLFAPMQFVDRALFPGEDDHVRPTKAMPNKWERVTLGVMLSSIIHKQYEWSKRLVCLFFPDLRPDLNMLTSCGWTRTERGLGTSMVCRRSVVERVVQGPEHG